MKLLVVIIQFTTLSFNLFFICTRINCKGQYVIINFVKAGWLCFAVIYLYVKYFYHHLSLFVKHLTYKNSIIEMLFTVSLSCEKIVS